MRDALRLAVGTLTVLPTAPPRTVDRATGGRAMALAPVIGALLVLPALVLLLLLGWLDADPPGPRVSPWLAAALVVTLLAVLTRGLHLDGAADTADGLGSGRAAPRALEIMRSGDVGPFGVATVVLLLLLQVLALGELLAGGESGWALVGAMVASRSALPLVCSRGVPAARPDGLGHLVAGTVGRRQLAAALALAVVLAAMLCALLSVPTGRAADAAGSALRAFVAATAGLLAAWLLCRRCVRRLGGVTGDVLGACVELAFTVTLVVYAVSTPGA